ncbi:MULTISPECIES: hypothetical protein [unclassified Thalassospira]|uniref:hypothetical protein n=1 Tax=unclassified Thalassospira TaxID=2648997 RepID=UPI0007A614E1|nr:MULTISPECIES: hypothetical protein [unclassified Thalassospira]KZD00389.1 hypothetical protein AUQ41_07360 [Thalassospira sp. MCCC 1A02898]ONH86954.1 hypothetical protein TH47_12350 [Thalassospira sp. MCCC 1A02803]
MGAVFANQIRAAIAFVGDGARTSFPFDFDVFDVGDVRVAIDGSETDTGFHIALTPTDQGGGGVVRFETPPQNGSTIHIARQLHLRRLSSFDAMSIPRGDALERDLDFMTAALGDVDRALSGALRFGADQGEGASAELPMIKSGRALIWNAAGTGLANGPSGAEIAQASTKAAQAQDAANRAEAAESRSEIAVASFERSTASAMLDLDFRSGDVLAWEDERRMPVIDAPVSRIMDIRETGSLVRLSSGAQLTLPVASIARNGVRFRVFNGDGTMVDITTAAGNVIRPTNGGAEVTIYPLPTRGDMVDLICDGTRWFAAPIHESGPVVKLLRTASQSIPAGGAFLVEWDQVIEDSHGLYDSAVHGVTGLPPGFYHVDIGVRFPITDQSVFTTLSLERFDGTDWSSHLQANDITAMGSGAAHSLRLNGIARINPTPGTGLRLRLSHSDVQTRDIGASGLLTWCHIHRIGG